MLALILAFTLGQPPSPLLIPVNPAPAEPDPESKTLFKPGTVLTYFAAHPLVVECRVQSGAHEGELVWIAAHETAEYFLQCVRAPKR